MSLGQMMLGEFDNEMQNTRKVLERVPDEKWNWKPHDKSGHRGLARIACRQSARMGNDDVADRGTGLRSRG